jgi:hypothetical protein
MIEAIFRAAPQLVVSKPPVEAHRWVTVLREQWELQRYLLPFLALSIVRFVPLWLNVVAILVYGIGLSVLLLKEQGRTKEALQAHQTTLGLLHSMQAKIFPTEEALVQTREDIVLQNQNSQEQDVEIGRIKEQRDAQLFLNAQMRRTAHLGEQREEDLQQALEGAIAEKKRQKEALCRLERTRQSLLKDLQSKQLEIARCTTLREKAPLFEQCIELLRKIKESVQSPMSSGESQRRKLLDIVSRANEDFLKHLGDAMGHFNELGADSHLQKEAQEKFQSCSLTLACVQTSSAYLRPLIQCVIEALDQDVEGVSSDDRGEKSLSNEGVS